MTLIIDMVTGEVLEEGRRPDVEPEAVNQGPRPEHYGPRPEVVPVTPDPRERAPEPPPPFLWNP